MSVSVALTPSARQQLMPRDRGFGVCALRLSPSFRKYSLVVVVVGKKVVAWRSGNIVWRINEVTLRRPR